MYFKFNTVYNLRKAACRFIDLKIDRVIKNISQIKKFNLVSTYGQAR